MLRVKPSAQTHTAAPHCGSHCHQLLSLRVCLTLHFLCQVAAGMLGGAVAHCRRTLLIMGSSIVKATNGRALGLAIF